MFLLASTAFGLHYAAGSFSGDPVPPLMSLVVLLAYATTGIAMGLAVQTKETLIPLVALPLLTPALPFGRPRGWPWLTGLYLACCLASFWAMSFAMAEPAGAVGDAAPRHVGNYLAYSELAQRSTGLFLVEELTVGLPRNLYKYLRHYLLPYFAVAPLMVLAFLWALRRALPVARHHAMDRPAVVLALAGALLAPGILIQGEVGERIGHGMPLHFVLLLLLAWWLNAVVAEWTPLRRLVEDKGRLAMVMALALAAAQSVFPGRATLELLFRPQPHFGGHFPLTLWRDVPFQVKGRFGDDTRRLADAVPAENVPPGALFLSGEAAEAIQFFLDGRAEGKNLSLYKSQFALGPQDCGRRVAGVEPYHGFRSPHPRYRSLLIHLLDDYESRLAGVPAAWLAIDSGRYRFWRDGLAASGGVRFQSGDLRLVKLASPAKTLAELAARPPWKAPELDGDLEWLRANYPDEAKRLADLLDAILRPPYSVPCADRR